MNNSNNFNGQTPTTSRNYPEIPDETLYQRIPRRHHNIMWPISYSNRRVPESTPNTPTEEFVLPRVSTSLERHRIEIDDDKPITSQKLFLDDDNTPVKDLNRMKAPYGFIDPGVDKPIAIQDQRKILDRMKVPYGFNEPEFDKLKLKMLNCGHDYQCAINVATELSKAEMYRNSNFVYGTFVELFYGKLFDQALNLYKEAMISCPDSIPLIDELLESILWRISCEYYQEQGIIKWLNSWIKIGWWPESAHEISPQLKSGKWVSNNELNTIDTNKFSCVVLKGKSKDVLLRILEAKASNTHITNVELKYQDEYWIPIAVAFKEPKHTDSTLDLATIDIGSLTELPESNLDLLRIPSKETIELDDGTKLHFFCGCVLGTALRSNNDFLTSSFDEDIDDGTLEFSIELSDYDEMEYYQSDSD